MPMNRDLYPDNWEAIALAIKTEVNWSCETCGRPCRRPGERESEALLRLENTNHWTTHELYDEEWNDELGHMLIPKLGRFVLTVAHLDHRPENCDRANLKALCAPCHCRYDLRQMPRKRQLKRERAGQLRLEGL